MLNLRLLTPHGTYLLNCVSEELHVEHVLKINDIPYNSVSAYRISETGEAELISFIGKSVGDLIKEVEGADFIFRTDRNINYQALLTKDTNLYKPAGKIAAEYVFDTHGQGAKEHVLLTQEECRSFVTSEVRKAMEKFAPTYLSEKIVVGISGGGDSNTLLKSLLDIGVDSRALVPVMMMGIPDWDKGLPRAQEICAEAGLSLRVVSAQEVGLLLGRDNGNWAEDFETFYPSSDLEVIGTLAVRLALSSVAREIGTGLVITGINLEDILAESFYAVMRGENLSPFPRRPLDGVDFLYPLYRCPKRILDGCYPKFSLENYLDRYPSELYWRAMSYYLAQSISTTLAGAEFMLVDGFQNLSAKNPAVPEYYDILGFSAKPGLTAAEIQKWRAYLTGKAVGGKK
ncbi:hypothetical protein BAnh1_02760 [Bartonella australis AUST/NH1]|uniref:NAD/GMP synthase domain-containing protein n=1 Tax=Bartonella australis (strain Aust/NH1) TaxID=1094489 RepID=M1N2L5_BARAA|nr:hypothetical protein [Bartonella australis]AGF74159.1 hypothetical protein BAnh1_02760 [Bartonella australis AUST/NH1]